MTSPSPAPPRAEPVTLTGSVVRLEPLGLEHLDALAEVGLDPVLWRWIPFPVRTREQLQRYIEDALRDREAGRAMPFVTIERATDRPIGSTRYGNIDLTNRRVEIGWTWVAPPWQRSAVNTEAKLLMLQHAFERLGCIRVEFKTDSLNTQSRNALLGIGAVEEGILRNHMVTETDRLRHSVYFSITDDEWPAVKAGLERRLAAGGSRGWGSSDPSGSSAPG
jgi:RimJ/RimL family protein N-acetyltransferase